jgi:aspartyl-tRNA(Asn)/glutamyl-tRNA(Gln) amidotransferase subunit C
VKVSIEDVRKVALLARLDLEAAEEERLVGELATILGYVEKLDRLETASVPPTSHVADVGAGFRDDAVVNRPAVDELLANAPDRSGDCFRVPKIIE